MSQAAFPNHFIDFKLNGKMSSNHQTMKIAYFLFPTAEREQYTLARTQLKC